MQHLRGVDDSRFRPVDNGAVFVSAPGRGSTAVGNTGAAGRSTVQSTHEGVKLFNKGKARAMEDEGEGEFTEMFSKNKHGLPVSVLPSGKEISWQQAQESTRAVPTSLTGFQPDMDPHLRQVLEALEDDAFVSNELDEEEEETDEGWFDELLGGGERGEEEPDLEEEFEFREEGIEPDGTPSWGPNAPKSKTSPTDGTTGTLNDPSQSQEGETWEDRFRAFKASGALAAARSSAALEPNHPLEDEDERSEAADTLASLRSAAPTVLGAKKRRRAGGSQASGYSMSSSSMFRNKGLTVLDEMFDKVSRKPYDPPRPRGCAR
jgi:protein LTV1